MKISVIIPAFNEEDCLPTCLTALKQQQKKPDEIIVIDNGSTDNTAKIAQSFAAQVVTEPQRGIIPARQRGFKVARGDIIARTDADSVAPPNWIAEIEKTFRRQSEAIAVTGLISFADIQGPMRPLINAGAHVYPFIISKLLGHPVLIGANFALKRTVTRSITPHLDDRLVHEDIDLSCHVAQKGKIVFNPNLKMRFSARRIVHQPQSFFGEYPIRLIRTIRLHHHYLIGPHRQDL